MTKIKRAVNVCMINRIRKQQRLNEVRSWRSILESAPPPRRFIFISFIISVRWWAIEMGWWLRDLPTWLWKGWETYRLDYEQAERPTDLTMKSQSECLLSRWETYRLDYEKPIRMSAISLRDLPTWLWKGWETYRLDYEKPIRMSAISHHDISFPIERKTIHQHTYSSQCKLLIHRTYYRNWAGWFHSVEHTVGLPIYVR